MHSDGSEGLVDGVLFMFRLLVAMVPLQTCVALRNNLVTRSIPVARRKLVTRQTSQEVRIVNETFALCVEPINTTRSELVVVVQ